MQPFPTRIRDISFWYYQTLGWLLYSTIQLGLLLIWKEWETLAFISVCIQLVTIYFLLLGLRLCYHRIPVKDLNLLQLVSRIVIASFLISLVWICIWSGIEYAIFTQRFLKYAQLPIRFVIHISYSFSIFLAWSALYFGIKAWRDWLDERDQAEHAIESAQHSQLQMLRYQLNPHFLFNALNSVRALVDEDAQSAKTMITELSEFLRYSLVSRNKPIVSLKDELDAIRLYLSIEQQRYEDKLHVIFDIDKHTEDVPVPSFLIHPLVEDALRNGMRTSTMPLCLEIHSTMNNETMKIDIVHSGSHTPNNGSGTQESGWEQVDARLKELFPSRYKLSSSQDNSQAHTILELVITNGMIYEEKIASHSHR